MDVAVGERNGLVDEAGWWTKRVVTDVTDVSGGRGGVVYNSCQQLFGASLFTTFIGLGQPRAAQVLRYTTCQRGVMAGLTCRRSRRHRLHRCRLVPLEVAEVGRGNRHRCSSSSSC